MPAAQSPEFPATVEMSSGEETAGSSAASWEWAISEAVAEVYPMQVPAEAAEGRKEPVKEAFGEMPTTPSREELWVYGSHHKAGTDLLRSLAVEHTVLTKVESCISIGPNGWIPRRCDDELKSTAQVWFYCELSIEVLNDLTNQRAQYRVVHVVRDPIAMVISGYIYHQSNGDTPEHLLAERHLPMVEGLALEAKRVLEKTGAEMVSTYLRAPKPETLHVRLESFMESSASFDATAEKVYNFTLGDKLQSSDLKKLVQKASKFDLRRHPSQHVEGHVADPTMKAQARKALEEIPTELLHELKLMRKVLGYK